MQNPPSPVPNSLAAKAWRAYQSEATPQGEQDFVEMHLPLVKTVVGRLRITLPATLDMDDLYSVGVTGLMTAAKRFDPTRNTAFPAFATQHIRGAVLDELRRMDYMSRGSRDKAHKLTDAINRVEQRTQQPSTPGDVARELGISEGEYESLLEEVTPVSFLPLDGEAFSENSEDIRLHEIIPDDTQLSANDILEQKELVEMVIARIQELPDMPRKILAMYYFEDLRLSEIAAAFGLTEGRISQIHTQAVLSLRAYVNRIANPSSSQCC
jgi:RNA polymerase sigma factor for flagellar operon FliA